jgi:hypothetical protein
VDVSCDAGNWFYNITTSTPTESADFDVVNTGDGTLTEEHHTLSMDGAAETGGEIYARELLIVAGYTFIDVATQFSCTDGTNPDLTWRFSLYDDVDSSVLIGCVSFGHDPSYFATDGCVQL